ncbi:LysR family transcriptional regulator [Aggregicoccus sp. 17bor-14]|uniref:LysR family transcriptional regulator n=1 Tax=Myxococcaceae TaxID=31 RepID=UPI00129C53A9|nr:MULTISPECIES: LysR family transcriptional regulator [Myxococcaceae]MBF5044446.1 LysR family transcriptional regulator [Simulacricoccus sp. 17bor-14]MRI90192.1 LysR family transcriptional regulator [Aggregicoccus sp. 17bor-14]
MQRSPCLPWDDVRLFLALCRARNLGGAAKALGVDASTVSRRLAALEEALAVTLFDRSREGITPTEAAEGLLPVAEELEVGMARFASAADALEREVAGLVRLTCPPDLAELLVAPLVKELLGRHPALRIALEPGEALRDLSRREADVALRTVRPTRGDLVVTRLTAVPWVLVGAPALVKQFGVLKRWEDAPWVGWGERLAHLAPARWLAAHARGVEPRVQSESLRVQLAAVAAGVGVALVPEPSVAHFGLAPVRLAPSLREDAAQWPVDELFLVTHRALREVPRVRVLWELLRERLGDGAR